MKNKKEIIAVAMIFITFVQGIIYLYIRENKNESKSVLSVVEENPIYIKDIDKSLSNLKNYNVVNRSKDEEDWVINVNIRGTKEELLSDLNLLGDFNIMSYNIEFVKTKGDMNLELKSR